MMLWDDSHAEVFRRELHNAVDRIDPAGDGLDRIRSRLAEPWLKRQAWLLRTEFRDVSEALRARSAELLSWARAAAGAAGAWLTSVARHAGIPTPAARTGQAGRHLPVHRSPRTSFPGRLLPVLGWLRPALAVAGAVLIVTAGVYALGQLRATFIEISLFSPGVDAVPASSTASPPPGRIRPSTPRAVPDVNPAHHHTGHHAHRATPAASCTPAASPQASPGVTPTALPSASPSPSAAGSSGAAPTPSTSTSPAAIRSSPARMSGAPARSSASSSCAQPGPTASGTRSP